jgi:hypothetical protein
MLLPWLLLLRVLLCAISQNYPMHTRIPALRLMSAFCNAMPLAILIIETAIKEATKAGSWSWLHKSLLAAYLCSMKCQDREGVERAPGSPAEKLAAGCLLAFQSRCVFSDNCPHARETIGTIRVRKRSKRKRSNSCRIVFEAPVALVASAAAAGHGVSIGCAVSRRGAAQRRRQSLSIRYSSPLCWSYQSPSVGFGPSASSAFSATSFFRRSSVALAFSFSSFSCFSRCWRTCAGSHDRSDDAPQPMPVGLRQPINVPCAVGPGSPPARTWQASKRAGAAPDRRLLRPPVAGAARARPEPGSGASRKESRPREFTESKLKLPRVVISSQQQAVDEPWALSWHRCDQWGQIFNT